MPIPTHREDCETKTWRTTCPDCGKPVWFLKCTCGSKAYFDNLGYPWNLHKDSCPVYYVRQMLYENVPVRNIRNLVESMARRLGKTIPEEVDILLTNYGAGGKPIINAVLPDPNPVTIKGVVKRCNPINIYKRLNLQENEIIRKILDEFASPLLEVVAQEIASDHQLYLRQWTFFIFCEDIKGCRFKEGQQIKAYLESVEVYEDEVFWVCTDWK